MSLKIYNQNSVIYIANLSKLGLNWIYPAFFLLCIYTLWSVFNFIIICYIFHKNTLFFWSQDG